MASLTAVGMGAPVVKYRERRPYVYGGRPGVALSSPDSRHPGSISHVHSDLRVLVAGELGALR